MDVDLLKEEDPDMIKTEIDGDVDGDGMGTEESEGEEDGVELEGEGDLEDQEQDTGEMMITINTDGEQSDLIINDQQIDNQS